MGVSRWREWTLLLAAFEYAMGHSFVGVLLLLILAVGELMAGEPLWQHTTLDPGLGGLVAIGLVSGLRSEWSARALFTTMEFAVGAAVVLRAMVLTCMRRQEFPRRLLWTLAFTAAAVAVAAVALIEMTPFHRAQVPHLGPNAFGTVLAMAAVILLGASLDGPRWRRVLCLAAVLPVAVALVLTWSRGAWLAAIIGVLVLTIVHSPRRLAPRFLVVGLLIFALIPILAPQWPRHAERLRKTLDTADPISRLVIWRAAVRIAADHLWFGTGFATFERIYTRYQDPPPGYGPPAHAHNIFLNFAVELGLPGLLAFVIFLGSGIFAMWRWHTRSPPDSQARRTSATALAALAALLGHQLVDGTLLGSSIAFGLYGLLGMGAAGDLAVRRDVR
ncbi:MAG: O-antigen ligase family protein [Armatimonadota bacterium]